MTAWPFGTLERRRYGTLLIDPPWRYTMRTETGYAKSPEAHYDTWPLDRIAALPIHELAAADCLVLCWSTWPHLAYAMEVLRLWGAEYSTGGAWAKRTRAGAPALGTGFVLRSVTEPYLVAKFGRPTILKPGLGLIETDEAIETDDLTALPSLVDGLRREHSRKPAEMRAMLDRMRPGLKAELFAREPWAGHHVWGAETGKFAGAA